MNKIHFPSKKQEGIYSVTEQYFERFRKNTFLIPQRMHELIQEDVLRQIQKKRKSDETIIENRNVESHP